MLCRVLFYSFTLFTDTNRVIRERLLLIFRCDFIPNLMKSPCRYFNCIQCCKETVMLLSNADIKRIENLGFSRDLFVDDVEGWLQLKNQNDHCVFHDGMKCLIYAHRPEGCTLYPIIYDMDNDCAVSMRTVLMEVIFLYLKMLENNCFLLFQELNQSVYNYKKD